MDSIGKEDKRDRRDREVEALETIAEKLESIDRKLRDLCKSLKRVKPVPIVGKAAADKTYDVTSIRRELPNAYERWSEKDDADLRQLYEQGMSVSDLSKRFGRGQGAIRSRLVKIGLSDAPG